MLCTIKVVLKYEWQEKTGKEARARPKRRKFILQEEDEKLVLFSGGPPERTRGRAGGHDAAEAGISPLPKLGDVLYYIVNEYGSMDEIRGARSEHIWI